MGNLTENFSRYEFSCSCGCGFDTVDFMLVNVLQDIRSHFNAQVIITSGNRCIAKNIITKGAARDSQHIHAKASDIQVKGVFPEEVYNYLDKKYPLTFGIGLYSNRVHVDVRDKKARWKG